MLFSLSLSLFHDAIGILSICVEVTTTRTASDSRQRSISAHSAAATPPTTTTTTTTTLTRTKRAPRVRKVKHPSETTTEKAFCLAVWFGRWRRRVQFLAVSPDCSEPLEQLFDTRERRRRQVGDSNHVVHRRHDRLNRMNALTIINLRL
jgi:hypothetical protein